MSEREEFEKRAAQEERNIWDRDQAWREWQAARAPLLERITALEAKCALLAASWQKAEEELEKIRAAQPKTSR
jgi:hypothetical protein